MGGHAASYQHASVSGALPWQTGTNGLPRGGTGYTWHGNGKLIEMNERIMADRKAAGRTGKPMFDRPKLCHVCNHANNSRIHQRMCRGEP